MLPDSKAAMIQIVLGRVGVKRAHTYTKSCQVPKRKDHRSGPSGVRKSHHFPKQSGFVKVHWPQKLAALKLDGCYVCEISKRGRSVKVIRVTR